MDKISDPEKLTEMVWCDHLRVVPQFLVGTTAVHAFLPGRCYLIVEEQKLKLVCPECWKIAVGPSRLFT